MELGFVKVKSIRHTQQNFAFRLHYHFYRSQLSWGKVMFLHVSVILFTGGGGIPACLAAGLRGWVVSQHALQVSRPTPSQGGSWRVWPRGSPDPHPGGSPGPHQGGLQAHTQGWSPGPHLGVCTEADPPPDGYCCERYASYWNALFSKISSEDITLFSGTIGTLFWTSGNTRMGFNGRLDPSFVLYASSSACNGLFRFTAGVKHASDGSRISQRGGLHENERIWTKRGRP